MFRQLSCEAIVGRVGLGLLLDIDLLTVGPVFKLDSDLRITHSMVEPQTLFASFKYTTHLSLRVSCVSCLIAVPLIALP